MLTQEYLDDVAHPYPFDDGAFDLGVTALVFQHIPFETIAHAMTEAARVCDVVAVRCSVNDQWAKPGEAYDPRAHCFLHNYISLCADLGLHLISFDDRSAHSVQFVYSRPGRAGPALASSGDAS